MAFVKHNTRCVRCEDEKCIVRLIGEREKGPGERGYKAFPKISVLVEECLIRFVIVQIFGHLWTYVAVSRDC